MLKKHHIRYQILGILILVIVVNLVASKFFFRVDCTADKRFTLDNVTKQILEEVKKPIIVTMYVSEDLPPSFAAVVQETKNLLNEYSQYCNETIDFEYVNPSKNEEATIEALNAGITPILVRFREKDKEKRQNLFLGMVIQVGDKSETIPLIKAKGMEYTISALIKKLTVTKKENIGYVWGHGEPDFFRLKQVLNEVTLQYNVDKIKLNQTPSVKKYKTLLIVAPEQQFNNAELNQLDNYLAAGGNLMIAMNRVNGNLTDILGVTQNTGLERWLQGKGVTVHNDFIVDNICDSLKINIQKGFFSLEKNIFFPYYPIIKRFNRNHAIAEGINQLVLKFTSPITYIGDTTKRFIPLAVSSIESGRIKAPIRLKVDGFWYDSEFSEPNLTVAATLEGKFGGNINSKICIIGDGDFVVNTMGVENMLIPKDNINFFANIVNWLSDDSGLINLRAKGMVFRPLDNLSDRAVFLIKCVNFFLPILLVIIYGFFIFQCRRKKRQKRRQPGYIG